MLMFGLGYYLQSFQVTGEPNLATYGLTLTPQDFVLVGISLFVTLIAALSLCLSLGTFAKNYKSAQTLTFPITMLALIPMIPTMIKDFDTLPFALKTLLFAIPFSHLMMVSRALLFGEHLLLISGIIYVAVFAVVTTAATVWVFKTDRLLIGSTRKRRKTEMRGQKYT